MPSINNLDDKKNLHIRYFRPCYFHAVATAHMSHQNELLNMSQRTPCLQMLSWKLHVRTCVSPRKSPFIMFITPSILNKNGGDRLRKMSISSIFEEEILENCWFWEVQTSGFGLCIIYPNYLSCFKVVPEPGQRNSFSKRLFVPQNTA